MILIKFSKCGFILFQFIVSSNSSNYICIPCYNSLNKSAAIQKPFLNSSTQLNTIIANSYAIAMSGDSSHLEVHNLNREISNNEVSSTSNDVPSTVVASASIIEPTSIDASTSGVKASTNDVDSNNGKPSKDKESLLVERFPNNSPRYVCEDESIWLDLHPKPPSSAGSEYSCSDDDEVYVVPNHRTVKRIRLSSTESIKE